MSSSSQARTDAIASVMAGESADDVAVRFNIKPDVLRRWVSLKAGESDAPEGRSRGSQAAHATILDVAERAQLSKSVVSRALRGQYGVSAEARERVERAALELGFVFNFAAQRLSSNRTNTLGVLVRDASAPFYGEMQSALQKRGRELNQRVFATSGALDQNDEQRALEDLIALRVDGLIVCSGRLPTAAIRNVATRHAVVVAGRPEFDRALNSVFGDEDAGATLLASHLVSRGHRRIVVLQPPAAASPVLHRRAGIMASAVGAQGGLAELAPVDDAIHAAHVALQLEAAAVMAPNDRYAVAILHAARMASRTIAVTGFDGVGPLAGDFVGLTTWAQPIEQIGNQAIDLLMATIRDRQRPVEHRLMPGTLHVAASTDLARGLWTAPKNSRT
jgi:DNA-binding LacI/PurR family transcriptional regulator